MDTSVSLINNSMILNSPVIVASGTFGYDGYGRGYESFSSLSNVGAIIPKTFTYYPREGNQEPRWYPTSFRQGVQDGETILLNSVGLTNPGIHKGIEYLNSIRPDIPTKLFASISGDTVEQFAEMAHEVSKSGSDALELNLSCPNTETGSMFSHDAALVTSVVTAVVAEYKLPVIVKLSPNVPNIVEIAEAAVNAGAKVLTVCNTMPAMKIDIHTRKPVLGNVMGGLSGISLKPISIALIHQIKSNIDIPIIGVGGVFGPEDIIEYLMVGASAVQVGSANLISPQAPIKLQEDLTTFMAENNIPNIKAVKRFSEVD